MIFAHLRIEIVTQKIDTDCQTRRCVRERGGGGVANRRQLEKRNKTPKFAAFVVSSSCEKPRPRNQNQEESTVRPLPSPLPVTPATASAPIRAYPRLASNLQLQTVFTSKRVGSINICFFSDPPLALVALPRLPSPLE